MGQVATLLLCCVVCISRNNMGASSAANRRLQAFPFAARARRRFAALVPPVELELTCFGGGGGGGLSGDVGDWLKNGRGLPRRTQRDALASG